MTELPRFPYLPVTALSLITLPHYPSQAQNEYLATLNYTNLALNRVGNIPGVTWVTNQSAYDQNHQRFFFMGMGSASSSLWQLYTINALTGATISTAICQAGNIGGNVSAFQYDNAADTLYALHSSLNGTESFVWIEPSTAAVHFIQDIPNFPGYLETGFDTKDHLYLVNCGGSVLGINASSGTILYNLPNINVVNMVFDNLTGKLFGISNPNSSPSPQLDSISLSTGSAYPFASLLSMPYIQIGAFTIDEKAGKYIIAAAGPPPPACIFNYIYLIDIQSGAVLSRRLYPYAQNTSAPSDENAISFSFDNQRGKLYALNWHPPNSTNGPFTITSSPDTPCSGSLVTFTAQPGTTVVNPSFQWQINRNNVGTNSPTYTSNNLVVGDTLRCILVNNAACVANANDTSNSLSIQFNPPLRASVRIVVSATTICTNE